MIRAIVLFIKFVVIAVTALLFNSCKVSGTWGDGEKGNGIITTENRKVVEDFTKVESNQGIDVEIEQSNTKSISVITDENIQKLIETKVVNGVLVIKSTESYNTDKTPKVVVQMPIIAGLESSSGSSIKSKNTLNSTNMMLKSSSGSSINVEVEAENITIETTSGSTSKVSGKALKLQTSSSSGSIIEAENLTVNEVKSQASSGSSTNVAPVVSLDAKASSGSSIHYRNNPKSISKDESSGGSVSKD